MGVSYKGEYHPSNKYKGSLPCIYRSLPELKMMRWMDNHPKIIEWGSESVIIPYIKPTDNRVHRYYMDFSCIFEKEGGKRLKYLLEYKPYKQTLPPTFSKKKKPSTMLTEQLMYSINMAKWSAAKEFAESKGYNFLIITEKNLI